MEVLAQLPQTDEIKREQIELVLAMQTPVRSTGWTEEDYPPMLQKAEAMAEELGDDKKRLRVRSILGIYYIVKGGNPQLGWQYLESCMEYPEIIQDVELMVPIGFDLCMASLISGDWQRINRVAPTIINLIESSGTQAEFLGKPLNPYSYILASWGMTTGAIGDFDQGERLCKKALSFALEIDHRGTIGWVEFHIRKCPYL